MLDRKILISIAVAVVLGAFIGVAAYRAQSVASCPAAPYPWLHPVQCTMSYALYTSDISSHDAFARVLSHPVLAAYVISPDYAPKIIHIPNVVVSNSAYAAVVPSDSNSAYLFAFWSDGSKDFALLVPVQPDQSMVRAVPARPDLSLCGRVLSELNLPVKYFRAYVEEDHNTVLVHCTYYLDAEYNAAASALSQVFVPALVISNNATYEIPDLNAAATLYATPEVVLDVYSSAKTVTAP